MKILVVDDDALLSDYIRQSLGEEGYVVDLARNCAEGKLLGMVYPYDALVLDVNLPDGTGFDVLEELRRRDNPVPVIMLTSRGSKEDVVHGLDSGADDYLVKPFVVAELKARVRALVRRRGVQRAETVTFSDLILDRLTHTISRGVKALRLTPKEFTLLEFFLLNPERVITRTELLEKVWNLHFDPGSNVVDTHVARLRAKLRRYDVTANIATVRGTGFVMRREQEEK
jgi:DNA-binding response OmpR family regulator